MSALKIVTFNLRITVDDGLNSWGNRMPHVVHKIQDEKPDIIGFQELTDTSLGDLKRQLSQYVFVGCGRNEQMSGESVRIAYLKDKLDLMSFDVFWFSETPDRPGSKPELMTLARPCNVAIFKNQETQQLFRVYNTHFDHMSSEMRVYCSQKLLKDLEVREQNISLPTIIMGDLNAIPHSKEIKLLVTNKPTKLLDTTRYISYTFHDYGKLKLKIDYIFVTETIKYTKATAWKDQFNGVYLSDHYPVMINIIIKA